MSAIQIAGATYTDVPSILVPKVGGGYAEYSEGGGGGPVVLKMGAIRPDAEIVQSYTYDKRIVADEGITIPAYSTSAKTLKASTRLSPTITHDLENYDYYITQRFLAYPEYNTDVVAKGRVEFFAGAYTYEVVNIPPNTYVTASGKAHTSRSSMITAVQQMIRGMYWTSATAIGLLTGSGNGTYMSVISPTIGSTVINIESPSLQIKGSTAILPSAVWSTMTDIRYQYIIEVWRAPIGNLNLDGWGVKQGSIHVAECWKNGGTLT